MDEKIQVLVRSLSGRTIPVYIEKSSTVMKLASVIAAEEGECGHDGSKAAADIRISYHGKPIAAGKTLVDAGIHHGSYLQATSRVRGGSWGSLAEDVKELADAVNEFTRTLDEANQ